MSVNAAKKLTSMDAQSRGSEQDGAPDLLSAYLSIRSQSIFALIPEAKARILLSKFARLEEYRGGQDVPRYSPDRCLVIVVQGQVGAFFPNDRSRRFESVKGGRSIELDTFLSQSKEWRYEWIAETNCQILRLSGKAFLSLLNSESELLNYLKKVAVHPELQKLKNDLKLFGFTIPEIIRTFASLKPSTGEGEIISPEGTLISVQKGEILLQRSDPKSKVLGHVTAGGYTYVGPETEDVELELGDESLFWLLDRGPWLTCAAPEKIQAFIQFSHPLPASAAPAWQEAVPTAEQPVQDVPLEAEDDATLEEFTLSDAELHAIHKRKPVNIKQHDQMDCGAACLTMVTKFHGKKANLAFFRSLVHVTREGASLFSIKRAAEKVGFRTIGLVANLSGLKQVRVPFITLMNYHFVVVNKVTDTEVTVSCPSRGVYVAKLEEFEKEFSQRALLLNPTPKLQELPESRSSFRKYLQIFRNHGSELRQIAVVSLILFILGLAQPFVMQLTYDTILGNRRTDLVGPLMAVLFATNTLNSVILFARTYVMTHLTSTIDAAFSSLFLRHVYSLPLNYFAVRRVGDITSRMGELTSIRAFFTSKPLTILLNLVSILVYGAVVGIYDMRFLWVIGVQVLVMAGLILYTTPIFSRLSRELFSNSAKNSSMMIEHFRGIETLRAIGGLIAARWRWDGMALENLKLSQKSQKMSMWMGAGSTLLDQVFNSALMLLAIYLFMERQLSLGQVVAVTSLAGSVIGPALALVGEWQSLNNFGNSLGRIDDVFTAAKEISPPPSPSGPRKVRGKIEFRDVEFRYGSELSPLVLKGINLTVSPGETVALVGRSGSGKTTLGFMVNLLYTPTGGQIFVDDLPASQWNLGELRRQVAMILQDNSLFSGSILENISLGDPRPSFHRVLEAAKAAHAHEFIVNMKQGYASHIGEGGSGLSGGQRQRLCVARALYLDPPVLIMDEATSSLDAVSELTIVKNLKMRKGTTILIAHRLNTILHANRIVYLDGGAITEIGSHKELMAKQGQYYELFRKQMNL